MPFIKGKSGNPQGRAVEQISKELWKKHGPAAFESIVKLAQNSTEERVRLDACKYVCDQAFGRATQRVEGTGKDGAVNLNINIKTKSK